MEENKKGIKYCFVKIITVQMICVFLLCAGAFSLKYIKPEYYKKVQKFYRDKLCEKTDTSEITKYFNDEV